MTSLAHFLAKVLNGKHGSVTAAIIVALGLLAFVFATSFAFSFSGNDTGNNANRSITVQQPAQTTSISTPKPLTAKVNEAAVDGDIMHVNVQVSGVQPGHTVRLMFADDYHGGFYSYREMKTEGSSDGSPVSFGGGMQIDDTIMHKGVEMIIVDATGRANSDLDVLCSRTSTSSAPNWINQLNDYTIVHTGHFVAGQ